MKESKLFTPWNIGTMQLKNRLAMAPMSLGFESQDGTINEKMAAYWEARARGGVALIIIDVVTVDPQMPYLGNTIHLGQDRQIESLRQFVEKMHAYGARVIPQISHPGPESLCWFAGVPPVGPSDYVNSMGQRVRALKLEEIQEIIEKYGDTARKAKEAGCDGIELHCAHAYMLAGSFLSPLRNKRVDRYGGSLDNRARFLLEVIRNIKAKAGEDFPIVLRISGDERVPGGNTLEDMLYLVPRLEEAGIDAFEVSGGTQYELCWKIIPCHGEPAGVNLREARAIKQAATVPVLVVGKIFDPRFAAHIVDSGYADGVVMGRALLADPELPRKAAEGRFNDIAPCTGCGVGCVGEQMQMRPGSCVINPALGRESELEIRPAETKKKVLVIGGGLAGLEAARVASLRGHQVTLLEKEDRLGGQINLAAAAPFKQELTKWVVYLSGQVEKNGVKVELNREATPELVAQLKPDAVIVATGAKALIPPIKGVDKTQVVQGHEILKANEIITSGRVLIIGGGTVGCELAETLLHSALGPMEVTIVEMLPEVAADEIPNNRIPLLKRLAARGVAILTSTEVKEIADDGVIVEQDGEEKVLKGFDHIVLSCGSQPFDPLSEKLKELVPQVLVVGDANSPRKALQAVAEGAAAGREV
ncbi:MAG: NAD(P)/FAD-dependent oxidoreductase [Dethiobacteria bacterium]